MKEEDEEEEEEEDEEEEWGDDIDALIEQLENDCASQVDLGWSCEILEMINDCMSGNEEACEELELLYEDFEEEEVKMMKRNLIVSIVALKLLNYIFMHEWR
ncbi:MAG: hypothetical protein CM15mP23_13140 [Cryomorphaceae bacterium]|nr:MAG: hypothetical protein CM15mP23_13140 [Cryomorphaceae bacterium]